MRSTGSVSSAVRLSRPWRGSTRTTREAAAALGCDEARVAKSLVFVADGDPVVGKPAKRLAKALEVLFILHADHEQNCSTNAVRSVGSSQVDPYSAVSAGIAALYGPLHGGANVLHHVGQDLRGSRRLAVTAQIDDDRSDAVLRERGGSFSNADLLGPGHCLRLLGGGHRTVRLRARRVHGLGREPGGRRRSG